MIDDLRAEIERALQEGNTARSGYQGTAPTFKLLRRASQALEALMRERDALQAALEKVPAAIQESMSHHTDACDYQAWSALKVLAEKVERLLALSPRGEGAPGGDGTMDTKETETPRRADMGRWTPAERAINDAMQAVEAMAADVRLTDAVVLLGAARDSVADYIDGVQTRRSVSSQAPSADLEEDTDPPCEGCGKPTAEGHRTDDDVRLCQQCWDGLAADSQREARAAGPRKGTES
jgi:hypothetical protein